MSTAQLTLAAVVTALAAVQLWRVPRLWAAVFMFIVLFPKMPLAVVPGNTTPLRVDDLVLAAVLGGWLVARLVRPSGLKSAIGPALAMYLGVALFCTLIGLARSSTDLGAGAFHFLRLVEYALLYYFFFTSVDTNELPAALRVFLTAWLLVALMWIVQHWTSSAELANAYGSWGTYAPSFGASYDFGGYVMMVALVCYAAWVYGGIRGARLTAALAAALFIAVNGDSRSSLVGIAAALAIDVFARLRVRQAVALTAVALTMPFLLQSTKMQHLLNVVSSFSLDTITRAFLTDPSIAMRLGNWQVALERWQQSPVVGDGLGAYLQYVRIYNLPGTPDGWYVRVLAETGILGLAAFMLLLGALLWLLLRTARAALDPLEYTWTYGAALVVLGASVNAFFIDTFVSFKMMGVFWTIMAIATRIEAEGRREYAPSPSPSPSVGALAPARRHA